MTKSFREWYARHFQHLFLYYALEYFLEHYEENKPKGQTTAGKFSIYRLTSYKERVIKLPGKVCRVSVEMLKIIQEMPA